MEMKLSENIRAFRKARWLTQEQLAEVLGVTVGAVYKWEAGLSQPELRTIMDLADFFDVSIDVLLGYKMKDNRLQATVERLKECRREKDRTGLSEAEKALKKYPNMFDIVHQSALLYRSFGVEGKDPALLRRALELLENAKPLLPQNTDPKVSGSTLSAESAEVLLSLGQPAQAVQLLQKNNAAGLYNDIIGMTLAADCGRPGEALPFLSEALLSAVASVFRIVMGYVNCYFAQNAYREAEDILQWGLAVLSGLKDGTKPCFLDKICGPLLICQAYARLQRGDAPAARDALRQAKAMAAVYDAAPDAHGNALRFISDDMQQSVYDDLGESAMQGVRKTVDAMQCGALDDLWKELSDCD